MNPNVLRFLRYLDFKIKCAAYQQENPLRLNMPLVLKCIEELEAEQEEKVTQLKEVMPSVPRYAFRKRPKQTQKKDGTPTKKWTEWKLLCKEHGVSCVTTTQLGVVAGYEEPNPNSPDQVKAWLESLGWEPCTLKYIRNKETNEERTIPQVRKEGELTPSVLVLKDQHPTVEILEGLTVIQHRLGVFKGYRDSAIQDPFNGKWYIRAEIGGLTNTLRFKHKKPIVNLPGVSRPWGREVRECLMADDGETFIGTDMVSLESTTKRHFIYPYDQEYAEEMSQPGFDEHLDLAMKNGAITKEEYDHYVNGPEDDEHKRIHKVRKEYKPVNYSAVYGVRPKKLSREMGTSLSMASQLLDAYWKRNWAVKELVKPLKTKQAGNYTWLFNPVSGFWYQLRFDKDRFSTLNQSTGVYVFDSWLARCSKLGYMGQMQMHDETGASVTDPSQTREIMQQAIEWTNRDLKCHVEFGIDSQTGSNYAECH